MPSPASEEDPTDYGLGHQGKTTQEDAQQDPEGAPSPPVRQHPEHDEGHVRHGENDRLQVHRPFGLRHAGPDARHWRRDGGCDQRGHPPVLVGLVGGDQDVLSQGSRTASLRDATSATSPVRPPSRANRPQVLAPSSRIAS